jgi:flagellar protein FliS
MNTTKFNSAVKQYSQVGVATGIEQASPHRLIQMLMGGAIDRIAIAKGAMERKDTANKGAHISWAISIIDGLRASLDKNAGGEIAQNLDDLYDYMIRRLMRANMEDNPDLLDEVLSLLRSIKTAWDTLPKQLHSNAG